VGRATGLGTDLIAIDSVTRLGSVQILGHLCGLPPFRVSEATPNQFEMRMHDGNSGQRSSAEAGHRRLMVWE
jgi:hypothetical protein